MMKKILLKYKWTILFYVINGIIQITAASLSLVYFQKLIDKIPMAKGFKDILRIFVIYGFLKVIDSLLSYLDEYPSRKLSNGIYQSFKIAVVEKIARIDYKSYQNIGTGKLIQVIENGATAGKNILFDFYLTLFKELIPSVVISLIFIGRYSFKIMIAIAVGYIMVFLLTNILLKHLYKIKKTVLRHEEELSRFSVRSFMELVVFRINKLFKTEIEKVNKTSNQIIKARTKIRMIHELFFTLFALIVIGIKLLIIFFGLKQVINGVSTIGTIVALISFVERIYTPIAIFNVLFVDYKLDKVAYDRFLKILNLPDDMNLDEGEHFEIVDGTIELRNVDFKYEEKSILNGLSMKITGGESAALVGKSGAGKSTIIKIILGLLKKSSGEVIVDEQELSNINLNTYYNYVSYLSQDAPIFDGTLRENIVFNNEISDEEIYITLEKVELKDFVNQLPKKLDTELGERGVKLSGGEKQRLAFARVFFQNSKIVILDEPTSALDSITEERVIQNLLQHLKDRTIITIAHRLKTIQNVDKIFVIGNGKVEEEGSFESLINKKGTFYDLWKKQI